MVNLNFRHHVHPLKKSRAQPSDRVFVILHGLFGSAQNWSSVARRLASFSDVFVLDLRNHGQSPHTEAMTYHDISEDLTQFIEDKHLQNVTLLGHSLGGKAAMVFAHQQPALIEKLIVADIAPVTYLHGYSDLIKIMANLDLTQTKTIKSADQSLAKKIPDPKLRQFLLTNLTKKSGEFSWRINLDTLAKAMPELLRFPELTTQFQKPTLFLSGAQSQYVPALYHQEIYRLFPTAALKQIRGGHYLHVENTSEFVASVASF